MGLEGMVGFNENFEPVIDTPNILKYMLVPGSFLMRAYSIRQEAIRELTDPKYPTINEEMRVARLEHAMKSFPGDLFFMGVGELVRLSVYALLAYQIAKAVSS